MDSHQRNRTLRSEARSVRNALEPPSSAPFPWAGLLALTLAFIGLTFLIAEPSLRAQGVKGASATAPPLVPKDIPRLALTMAVVLALVLLHAFLATAEIALVTIRKVRLRQLVEESNPSALLVEKLLSQPTRLMATIQTSVILVGIFAAGLAAVSIVPPVKDWIRAHSSGLVEQSAAIMALALVMLPVAALSLIVGAIAPRSLAIHHSERLALLAARPIYLLQILLAPAVAFVTVLSNLMLRPFGGSASFLSPAVNEEELKLMVEASEEQGVLEAEETEMIQSILTFSETVARKVMTPRIDMTGVEVDATLEEILQVIRESGHSRIPVFCGDLDNIIGIVHAKDLLMLPPDLPRTARPLRDVMRPAYFIPETKKIDELLAEFRRNKLPLAIVRDEYGAVSGLVSMEDVLEEIVGDIQDEYDREEPMIEVISPQVTRFDGRTPLDEVNAQVGLNLPEDEADTIGGFVFNLLGHQAEAGESVTWGNAEFLVEATDGRRITRVRLEQHTDPADPPVALPPLESPFVLTAPEPHLQTRPEVSGVETAPHLFQRP